MPKGNQLKQNLPNGVTKVASQWVPQFVALRLVLPFVPVIFYLGEEREGNSLWSC